jgi:hypothetical protein
MKKVIKPVEITLTFQEGINRIIQMYNDFYHDIINDGIVELQKCDAKIDDNDIKWIAQDVADKCKEKESVISALNQCKTFYDVLEFAKNADIFEGSEELIIGSFLGQQIDIKYS